MYNCRNSHRRLNHKQKDKEKFRKKKSVETLCAIEQTNEQTIADKIISFTQQDYLRKYFVME